MDRVISDRIGWLREGVRSDQIGWLREGVCGRVVGVVGRWEGSDGECR